MKCTNVVRVAYRLRDSFHTLTLRCGCHLKIVGFWLPEPSASRWYDATASSVLLLQHIDTRCNNDDHIGGHPYKNYTKTCHWFEPMGHGLVLSLHLDKFDNVVKMTL